MRIEQSSGLTDDEIERMRKDGEDHAEDDKKLRELAETRNKAEAMCFELEKMMKEHEDKLGDADKDPLKAAVEKTREAAKGDDVEQIKSAISELEQASHALSKVLYESAQTAAGGAAAGDDTSGVGVGDAADGGGDDVIDADFEVKDS